MTDRRIRFVDPARARGQPGARAPVLPLLAHVADFRPADWLRGSLTTFAERVASFLPGHFEAYARVYHPFENGGGSPPAASRWRDLAAAAGKAGNEVCDPAAAADFALYGVSDAQAMVGTLPLGLVGPLVEHLGPGERRGPAASTLDGCA